MLYGFLTFNICLDLPSRTKTGVKVPNHNGLLLPHFSKYLEGQGIICRMIIGILLGYCVGIILDIEGDSTNKRGVYNAKQHRTIVEYINNMIIAWIPKI